MSTMRDYSRHGPPWEADYVLNPFKHDTPVPVADALLRYGITDVRKRFGTWAVTTHRVACLVFPYDILASDLRKPKPEWGWSWEKQLLEKRWTVQHDVLAALTYAREVFGSPPSLVVRRAVRPKRHREISLRVRYQVLRRDGYRCQLCGRTADDGVTLHLDHRVPFAKGGATDEANLRTLCADCNLGKGVQDA